MDNFNKFAPQGRTKLISGSVLSPELSGLRLIVVPCSETGKPDSVLHQVLDKKWHRIGQQLKGWFAQHVDFKLGNIHTTAIQSDTWAIHFLCYDKDEKLNGLAVEACIKKLSTLAIAEKASVHFSAPLLELIPSLADLVTPYLLNKGVHTYFYQEPAMVEGMAAKEVVEASAAQEQAIWEASMSSDDVVETPKSKPAPKSAKKKSVAKKTVTKSAAKKSKPAKTVKSATVVVEAAPVQTTTADDAFLGDLQKLDE